MLSEKDFEKLWFLYKMEGAPKNVAIEDFCKSQGVNPSVFTKWLKMRERRIEPVLVVGRPEEPETAVSAEAETPEVRPSQVKEFVIELQNGTKITKQNLSYQELKHMVEKLEVLC